MASLTIEDIISKTADLPTAPAAAMAVMRETDSATGCARSVAKIISQDQALAVRILRLANSAYYGLSRQVVDVPEAVVVLGMRSVRNLSMVASTYPWMSKPLLGYGLAPKDLWRHSFGVAVGSQLIASKTGKVPVEQAFTAGLLHDLGKVAMSVWLESKLVAMVKLAQQLDLTFDDAERKVLGYDHAEVGGHVGEQWNLPASLVDVMRWHHRPDECEPHSYLVDCVHVADYLCMAMGVGLGGDGLRYNFSENTLARLGLKVNDLDALTEEFMQSYEQHEKLFEAEEK